MKRNKKCNIAGILFTLLLIYETYSYVMFLKVLFKYDVETAWRLLYFRSYADGGEWVMLIGKLCCNSFADNHDQFFIQIDQGRNRDTKENSNRIFFCTVQHVVSYF